MMRLAPDGKIIWVPAAFAALICLIAAGVRADQSSLWIGLIGVIPFLVTALFFRDPERDIPDIPGAVLAPADGKIIKIAKSEVGESSDSQRVMVSIFMSPLNVHVNRIPISGVVTKLRYNKGKFLTAFHEKASQLNEQQRIGVETPYGNMDFVQIAGWLARRIICNLEMKQKVESGQRFGLIRFGSRLDLYLPAECELKISIDQKVCAGETIIGVFHEKN